MTAPIPYSVTVENVHELAIRGWADLGFWRKRLAPEGLEPADVDGYALLHIGATSARFIGMQFRELVICVLLREPAGVFLAHAFNSVRAFAWIERTLFGTPYYPAEIAVEADPAARLEASLGNQPLLQVSMHRESAAARLAAAPVTDEVWEVPIYLPTRPGRHRRKLFYARLVGQTQSIPFELQDAFTVQPVPQHAALGWLAESQFTPRQWIIRPAATHSKSKTIDRPTSK